MITFGFKTDFSNQPCHLNGADSPSLCNPPCTWGMEALAYKIGATEVTHFDGGEDITFPLLIWVAISHLNKMLFVDKKPMILKLSSDDEERELEFELNYLASLTFEERLKMMREKSREMLRQMIEHGHRRPFEISKWT